MGMARSSMARSSMARSSMASAYPAGTQIWTPASLYAKYSGVGGYWDFTDMATLFQNVAGILPVTAASQPVGLVLDQSRRGEEILIPQPAFNMSPSVTRSGDVLTFASSAAGDQASTATSVINSTKVYRLKITVTGTGSVVVYVGAVPVVFGAGSHDVPAWDAASASNYIFRANTGGFNGTVAIEGLWELPGNHVIQYTAGKRPAYNGAGITPDGVDDAMTTVSINFTGCDKMVTGMGYAKLDTTERVQAELGNINTQAGTCVLISGNTGGISNQFSQARGSVNTGSQRAVFPTSRPNEYGAHIGRHSLPGDLSEVWWNGTKGDDGTGDTGAGNFGNWPLFFFARDQTINYSNTPTRRAIVLGIPVASAQMTNDDIELIRQWLMEGA